MLNFRDMLNREWLRRGFLPGRGCPTDCTKLNPKLWEVRFTDGNLMMFFKGRYRCSQSGVWIRPWSMDIRLAGMLQKSDPVGYHFLR